MAAFEAAFTIYFIFVLARIAWRFVGLAVPVALVGLYTEGSFATDEE